SHLWGTEAVSVGRDLPLSYHRELPKVGGPRMKGASRVQVMALELIRHSDARLDPQRLERFMTAFQTVAPLSLGELWAWPSALKAALVENLRRLADELMQQREGQRQARRFLRPLEEGDGAGGLGELPAELETPFVVELLARMREFGPRASALRARLDERLHARGQTPEDLIRAEQQSQASAQVSIANTITSLRSCATYEWNRYVEKVSLVEQILQRDPMGLYGRQDFATRDRYRQAVEEIAAPTGEAQSATALKAVEHARKCHEAQPEDRSAHVGWHLIGRGRRPLERAVAFRPRPGQRLRRLVFRHATLFYLGSIGFLVLAAVGAAVSAARGMDAAVAVQVAVGLLTLLPASELAIA